MAYPIELRADKPVWVLCASGFRASIAASLLERHGYRAVVLAHGGVADVLARGSENGVRPREAA